MGDAFLGEIRIFAGAYPPSGWALCNGQLLSINQHRALFSLLGTIYGGDGSTTFALPDLRSRAALMAGQGQGLSPRAIGDAGGKEKVTLNNSQLPSHAHTVYASAYPGTQQGPANMTWGQPAPGRGLKAYHSTSAGTGPSMDPGAFSPSGGNQPHNNLPPYLTLNFVIALAGDYPPRP